MSNLVTKEQLKRVAPKGTNISDSLLETINNMQGNEVELESFRENLLGYTSVLKEGKYKFNDYINAVKYSSYKLLGASNIEAYTKTFPDRFQRLVDDGMDDKAISSYVAAYHKNKMVQNILDQARIPTHMLNADIYQKAINVQAQLMVSANSEKVRSDAANSLLTHLKAPEVQKMELDIGIKEDKSVQDLRKAMIELAKAQRNAVEEGDASAKDIAHSQIIEGEIVEDD